MAPQPDLNRLVVTFAVTTATFTEALSIWSKVKTKSLEKQIFKVVFSLPPPFECGRRYRVILTAP